MSIFKIENGKIALVKHKVIIQEEHYPNEFINHTHYLTDSWWKEWSEQLIPKHKKYELISHEDIDISDYAWVDGADVSQSADPLLLAQEMVKYNSKEEYETSLPSCQLNYQCDLDYRISKLELGI